MVIPRPSQTRVCPFINRDDPRCAHRFRLSRVSEAFGVCLNAPTTCPIYHQLMGEQQRERPTTFNPTIHITVEGRVPPRPRQLRRAPEPALAGG